VEGEWYAVRDLADVFVSVMTPGAIAPTILHDRNPSVSDLGSVESAALVYLVAFELERFDLRYELGTEHPRLGWSPRPPAAAQDPRVAGPDGIDTAAPLARTGMISPALASRTVATFAGGFKREHGAFRYGPFAGHNHGSHYGFVEEGVIFSTLQPGLATVWTTQRVRCSCKRGRRMMARLSRGFATLARTVCRSSSTTRPNKKVAPASG